MEEEWRPVVDWEGWYSVSSLGRVRRERAARRTYPGRILKGTRDRLGYVHVGLTRGSHASLRPRTVHQLVARAFIGPPPEGLGVNHINGVTFDNRVENLEWATPLWNSANAVGRGAMVNCGRHKGHKRGDEHPMRLHPERVPRGEQNGMTKITDAAVRDILTSPLKGVELARKYGVAPTLISQIRKRTIWRHVSVS